MVVWMDPIHGRDTIRSVELGVKRSWVVQPAEDGVEDWYLTVPTFQVLLTSSPPSGEDKRCATDEVTDDEQRWKYNANGHPSTPSATRNEYRAARD